MTVTESLLFPHEYAVEVLGELPGTAERTFWFKLPWALGSDGLLLSIENQSPWVGVFGQGRGDLSGFWSMPSSNHLLVCAGSVGYVVNATDPADWKPAIFAHIVQVYAAVAQGLLLVADFCHVAAYGSAGVKWKSDRLTLDGVKIESADSTSVTVRAYTPKTEQWDVLRLSLENGSVIFR
jgi:hypothetical protein